jgi:hypothetical protein
VVLVVAAITGKQPALTITANSVGFSPGLKGIVRMGSPNANEVIIIIIAVCDYAQSLCESKKNPTFCVHIMEEWCNGYPARSYRVAIHSWRPMLITEERVLL